jgi:hypothetical protein
MVVLGIVGVDCAPGDFCRIIWGGGSGESKVGGKSQLDAGAFLNLVIVNLAFTLPLISYLQVLDRVCVSFITTVGLIIILELKSVSN